QCASFGVYYAELNRRLQTESTAPERWRGIKLGRTESLETIHLLDSTGDDPISLCIKKKRFI
ncbi:MAG: hypothetical protein ACLR8P_15390, partial [Clostridium fessum]